MARPKKDIDPKLIEGLAANGCTVAEIAILVGCGKRLLESRFRAVIEKGRAGLQMSLRRKQVEVAKTGNSTMLIWLGKQILGQRDKQEVSGPGGDPITFVLRRAVKPNADNHA